MLLVLDNARDFGQVRPLLTGSAGCTVLTTGRDRLLGPVAIEGAHQQVLNPLSADEARQPSARRIGVRRPAAEPHAADVLINQCARLPLALNIAAAPGRRRSRPTRIRSTPRSVSCLRPRAADTFHGGLGSPTLCAGRDIAMRSLKVRCTAAAIIGLALVALVSCSSSPKPAASSPSTAPATHTSAAISLTSTAFQEDGAIPKAYTCDATDGEAVSPPLAWSAVPPGTGWIGLYVYDNTGSVLHWIVLNIKPDVRSMAAGGDAGGFEVQGYLPMCPGAGNTDQYEWTLYAEPSSWHPPKVGGTYGVDPAQLAAHALGMGSLTGSYSQ